MTEPSALQPTEEVSTRSLIEQIKDGSGSAKLLTIEQRQNCVGFLRTITGLSYAQIAHFLSVSEKTIQRDIIEIRARNAADPPSEEFARQRIGDYLVRIDIHHVNLVRLAQDKNVPIEARIVAEVQAARVLDAMMARLQSLGYLPQQGKEQKNVSTPHRGKFPGPPLPPVKVIFTSCVKDLDGGEHAAHPVDSEEEGSVTA